MKTTGSEDVGRSKCCVFGFMFEDKQCDSTNSRVCMIFLHSCYNRFS